MVFLWGVMKVWGGLYGVCVGQRGGPIYLCGVTVRVCGCLWDVMRSLYVCRGLFGGAVGSVWSVVGFL